MVVGLVRGIRGMLTRTTTQILESLRDPSNGEMWRQFDERYRPILIGFARRQGLADDDAADVAQTALTQFAADYREGKYQRERGRLSSWIIGIARNRITDLKRAQVKRRIDRGESALIDVSDDETVQRDWEDSRQRVILERAMHVLRSDTRLDERTIRAFDLCALRQVPPQEAAAQCGMSVAEVYVAKNRAIKKLREIVAQLTQEFDEP